MVSWGANNTCLLNTPWQEAERGAGAVACGEVVRVVKRRQKEVVASLLEEGAVVVGGAVLCGPRDPRLPLLRIFTREGGRLAGVRFVVRIDAWERDSAVPEGHVTRVVGPIGELEAECRAVLADHDISEAGFSAG